MDGQGQGVVDAAAKGVGPEEDPLPGEGVDHVAGQELGEYHGRHHPLQLGVRAHEGLDLWVFS